MSILGETGKKNQTSCPQNLLGLKSQFQKYHDIWEEDLIPLLFLQPPNEYCYFTGP